MLHVVQGAPEVIQRPQGQGPEETLRNLDEKWKRVAGTKRQAVLHIVQGAPEVIQRPQGQGPEETLRNLDEKET